MKTLKLKAIHRILAVGLVEGKGKDGGSLTEQNQLLKLVDKLNLTQEERKKMNVRIEKEELRWQTLTEKGEVLDVEVEIELSDEGFTMLREILKSKSDKKEIKMSEAPPLFELAAQLNLEV